PDGIRTELFACQLRCIELRIEADGVRRRNIDAGPEASHCDGANLAPVCLGDECLDADWRSGGEGNDGGARAKRDVDAVSHTASIPPRSPFAEFFFWCLSENLRRALGRGSLSLYR